MASGAGGLPRSEGRGPIEAFAPFVGRSRMTAVSHGQKAVDPLKPASNPVAYPQYRDSLPRSEGRGPIEAARTQRRARPRPCGQVSHGQKAVDPLKLRVGIAA